MAKKTHLIQPSQVEQAAERKEKENRRFCSFLKGHADPDTLDRQFLELHKQIFPRYDCSQCRNCCKLLHAEIPTWEVDRNAAHLNMTREEFIAKHLIQGDFGEWTEKHLPCGFLAEDGECRLGDCRPDSCKKFPYTDQPERLFSLHSILNAVSVCPAAYEILEALKLVYDFDSYCRRKRRSYRLLESNLGNLFIVDDISPEYPCAIWDENEEDDTLPEDLPF